MKTRQVSGGSSWAAVRGTAGPEPFLGPAALAALVNRGQGPTCLSWSCHCLGRRHYWMWQSWGGGRSFRASKGCDMGKECRHLMGNMLTCCMKPNGSPKFSSCWGRTELDYESDTWEVVTGHKVAVAPLPTALDQAELYFITYEGHHLQHMSDREMLDKSALGLNLSDHLRASTIFLNKSQTDEWGKRKNNYLNHISPGHLTKKCSSCSTIFVDDSTVSKTNLRTTVQCVTLAIYYHIKNRDANRWIFLMRDHIHSHEKWFQKNTLSVTLNTNLFTVCSYSFQCHTANSWKSNSNFGLLRTAFNLCWDSHLPH